MARELHTERCRRPEAEQLLRHQSSKSQWILFNPGEPSFQKSPAAFRLAKPFPAHPAPFWSAFSPGPLVRQHASPFREGVVSRPHPYAAQRGDGDELSKNDIVAQSPGAKQEGEPQQHQGSVTCSLFPRQGEKPNPQQHERDPQSCCRPSQRGGGQRHPQKQGNSPVPSSHHPHSKPEGHHLQQEGKRLGVELADHVDLQGIQAQAKCGEEGNPPLEELCTNGVHQSAGERIYPNLDQPDCRETVPKNQVDAGQEKRIARWTESRRFLEAVYPLLQQTDTQHVIADPIIGRRAVGADDQYHVSQPHYNSNKPNQQNGEPGMAGHCRDEAFTSAPQRSKPPMAM